MGCVDIRRTAFAAFVGLALSAGAGGAVAAPFLVVDAGTGQTLIANAATQPWYPASLTKLMTTYVALNAVREGRLTLDTPLTMSLRAARMAPSKMGFNPGTLVTLDNALKMLMVKSPNDVAVMVAEGVSGSVEAFADEMNATAAKLGMRESHFVNPNGLHDPGHYSSARDMAIVARALLRDFPEQQGLFNIGAIQLDDAVIPNHNGLLGRYPGADGMKTGFTCAAGFNIVASATHDGRKLIAVVLGSPSARERNLEAAQLFERGFAMGSGGTPLEALPAAAAAGPTDMRGDICSRRNRAAVAAAEEEFAAQTALPAPAPGPGPSGRSAPSAAPAPTPTPLLATGYVHFDPVPVFVGPIAGWTGPVLAARPAPGAPSDVTAYANEKGPEAAPGADSSAPIALQGAVKPPPAKVVAAAPPERPRRPVRRRRWRRRKLDD